METEQILRIQFIIDSIKSFKRNNPQDWKNTLKRVKEMRDTRATPFGSDKQKEFRFEFTIPEKLYNMLSACLDNPKFLSDKKEVNWFAKTFKQLTIPEKW